MPQKRNTLRRPVRSGRRVKKTVKHTKDGITRMIRVNGKVRFVHVTKYKAKRPAMIKLSDGVFQGPGLTDVPFGIEAVIDLQSVNRDVQFVKTCKAFVWVPIPDSPDHKPTMSWLDWLVETMVAWRVEGYSILVHCTAGVSRSSLVTVAYFMKTTKKTRDEAFAFVKQVHPAAQPNVGFMESLLEYEKYLTDKGFLIAKEKSPKGDTPV